MKRCYYGRWDMSRHVHKPWGGELIWAETDKYVGKILFIRAGEELSLQYHEKKEETIIISRGRIKLEFYRGEDPVPNFVVLATGDAFHIPPGMKHRMIAIDD